MQSKALTDLLALHLQQTFHQNAWSINTAPTTNFSSRCSLHSSTRRITARYNFFYKQIPWAKNKCPYLRQVDPLSLEIHCFLYYTVFYTIIHDCWNYLFLVAIRHYLIFDLFDAGVIFVLVLSMLNFIWVIYIACGGNGFRRNTTTYSTIFFGDPIILEKPLALRKSLIRFKNPLFVVTHFSVILARCCFMHCLR